MADVTNGNGKKWLTTLKESLLIIVIIAGVVGWGYVLNYRVSEAEGDIRILEERNQKLNESISKIDSNIQYIRGKLDNE